MIFCWQATRQTNGTLSPLEKAAVRSTMRQLAQAISYTHPQGIVHRDVKPENVLLQYNGNIALCDFGISKDIISNKYESTMVLSAVGTAAYCAPEAGEDCVRSVKGVGYRVHAPCGQCATVHIVSAIVVFMS